MLRRALILSVLMATVLISTGCCGRRAYIRAMRHGGVYTPDSPCDCNTGCGVSFKSDSPVMFDHPVPTTPVVVGAPVLFGPAVPYVPQPAPAPMPTGNNPIGISEGVIPPMQVAPLPAPNTGKK